MSKYYVTMTDTFFSGWGKADGKINKLVIACDTMDEALIVQQNALARGDQTYVNITDRKPSYNSRRYLVSWHDRSSYPRWFQAGAFGKH